MNITLEDIIEKVATKVEMDKRSVEPHVRAVFATIREELAKGNNVIVRRHFRLNVKKRRASKGRSFQDGGRVDIAQSHTVKFVSSDILKQQLKSL